jgi:hypothetical protein
MNPKIFKLISSYSPNLSEADRYLICTEISSFQRSFKWNEWDFGLELIDRPEFINQLSLANLLRVVVVLTETEKVNSGFFNRMCQNGFIDKIIARLSKTIDQPFVPIEAAYMIDGTFDVRSDTAPNRDPDQHSATLRQYHKLLWSKSLPNGDILHLSDKVPGKYLYHKSDAGEFNLTSDSISHSYRKVKRMKNIIDQVPHEKMLFYYNSICCIGGYTLFPGGQRLGFQTINQARGCNQRIVDRFDLTLECVRRYYKKEDSPLQKTFEGYNDFFSLFETFTGYIEFFEFQDLVSDDYSRVEFFLPFDDSFPPSPFPKSLEEYYRYINNTLSFVTNRTDRVVTKANVGKPNH